MAFSTCFYRLNNVPLDSENCIVTVGSTLLSAISVDRTVSTVPQRHGSIPSGMTPRFSERQLSLQVCAWEPDVLGESSRLMRLCTMPNLVMSRIIDGVEQRTRVELTSLSPDDSKSHPNRFVPFTAVFAMPDVWWRSVTHETVSLPLNGGKVMSGGSVMPSAGYYTFLQGVPNASPSVLSTQLPYSCGDAPITDMVFRFPKGVTGITVKDTVSGTGITWSGTRVDARPYLYLDAGSLTAWSSDSDSAWSGGSQNETVGLDYLPSGRLQVNPDVSGDYRIAVKATGSGNVACRFKRSWW